ncbi:hypothetical protein EAF04_008583 [Stromatinia cepivora]|nr:hypothetical protein EAF04_008583 [Stromatinia cepivora]
MSSIPYGLIKTRKLHGAYLDASDPKKRESATVPLWENILNYYIATDDIAVNGQQPVDDTTKAVDIMVRYYDNEFRPIILLMVECKRHSRTPRSVQEMEEQLYNYVGDSFLPEGLAHRPKLYGAVAFGTKIRAWTVELNGNYCDLSPYWGSIESADMGSYKDAGEATDATEIYNFFAEAKREAQNALTGPQATSAIPQASHTPIATSSRQLAPSLADSSARLAPVASSSHTQSSISANPTRAWYYTDATRTYSLYSNSTLVSNTPNCPENEWVYCDGGWPGEGSKKWLLWNGTTPQYQ